jgi:hypothetical protein
MAGNAKMSTVFEWHNYDTLVDLFYDGNPSMTDAECAAHAIMSHDALVTMNQELLDALKLCRFDSLNMTLADWAKVQDVIVKAEAHKA